MGRLDLLQTAADLLHLLRDRNGVGPETQFLIPLGERECLESGPISFLDLPVLEHAAEPYFMEVDEEGVELFIF